MSFNRLFNLPNELISSLLTDWLRMRDLVRFDGALCNKVNRKLLLFLIKEDCIFRSVSTSYSLSWCIARQIRARLFFSGYFDKFNNETEWLRISSQFIATVALYLIPAARVTSIVQIASRLQVLRLLTCRIEDNFWDMLLLNPHLVELHLCYCIYRIDQPEHPPTNMPLTQLKKLELQFDASAPYHYVAPLLRLFPNVENLMLCRSDVSQLYAALPDAFPKLVHLSLFQAFHKESENELFCNLMSELKIGLQCLILPEDQQFTSRELQSIAEYHGHSLRCFSIPGDLTKAEDGIADLVNSLTQLHTLQMTLRCLEVLSNSNIVNTSITHLIVDYYDEPTEQLPDILGKFAGLTTLSLLDYQDRKSLVGLVTRVLELRSKLHAVCVDDRKIRGKLKATYPCLNVMEYTHIDVFTQQF